MGIAIGAAVPVLLSALGANVSGKRTAFVYLLIDVLGVVIWATVFYIANAIAHFDFMTMTMTTVSIALMNTLFRLATVIVLTPLIGLLEKCVCLLIPENPESIREEQEMDRLEERFLLHPALALEQSRQVTDAMARRAMDNLLRAMDLVHKFSDKGCRAVEDAENAIDRYEDRLGTYLMKITGKELSQRQSEEVSKYLHTISDFERISDHALNICDAAREINAKSVVFSPEAEPGASDPGAGHHRDPAPGRRGLRLRRPGGRLPGGAAGGDRGRPVRRDEAAPCGPPAKGRVHPEPGLHFQRPADQL